jgi:hypothetical protein
MYARSCSTAPSFTLRIELVFEMSNPCKSQFSMSKRLILFQIALLGYSEETQVFLERKQSLFEAEASSTLFPCQN